MGVCDFLYDWLVVRVAGVALAYLMVNVCIPHVEEIAFVPKEKLRYCSVLHPIRKSQDPAPKAVLRLFLESLLLLFLSLCSLISICLNLPFGTLGRPRLNKTGWCLL